ncbi:hypothetical protein JOC73_000686 [Alkaliphilus hydrothermalis]|uniref:Transposase InsH N-terminal domain-containing protein n=1 Tax=Alkaliphilus hydrothermalis TaxID=1482730 RepID=A0ABS2NMK1_9FIRM|nr:hypothetical protein [Alkaliphilus hydrothermalis]
MYKNSVGQLRFGEVEIFQRVSFRLDPENRWVKLADLIPWWEFEEKHIDCFKSNVLGQEAFTVRVALGTLIIKTKLNISDEETVLQISENKYLQYFIDVDLKEGKKPVDASLITHFRKRLGPVILIEENNRIAYEAAKREQDSDDDNDGDEPPIESNNTDEAPEDKPRQGTLILDATFAPSDIKYPTDLSLLNKAREKLEVMIDKLHVPDIGTLRKPLTNKKVARKDFLSVEKLRRKPKNKLKQALRKQLKYVKKDLEFIDAYLHESPERLNLLSSREITELSTIRELYIQQQKMFDEGIKSVENRIVSISQPHVRPIVRGKAGSAVEFGCKLLTGVINGYSVIFKMSWDNFNEGIYLQAAVEAYAEEFGYYPEAVIVDAIFRNRDNLDI